MKMSRLPLTLLLLAAGCRKEEPGGSSSASAAGVAGAVAVRVVESVVEGSHRRLRIAATVSNPGSAALIAEPPLVQLWAGTRAVPPFLAAGLAPSVVEPGKAAEVETHWWLGAEDTGRLELEIQGRRVPVQLP